MSNFDDNDNGDLIIPDYVTRLTVIWRTRNYVKTLFLELIFGKLNP